MPEVHDAELPLTDTSCQLTPRHNPETRAATETDQTKRDMRPELANIAEVLDAQEREIASLRAALAWYAEPGNWKRPTRGRSWSNAPACDDRGSRARMVMMEAGS